jgi:helicase
MRNDQKNRPTDLFPPQAELLALGFKESNENWVISAPTGAGKTLMAEWALEASLRKGLRCAYLAPLKAIVDERMQDWSVKFAGTKVGLFTGDSARAGKGRAPDKEQLLLFTPEKLAAYLSNWKKHLPWLAELDAVVIDELHLLGDTNRGATIEALTGRLQRINPFVRFIGLSGTLSNAEEIAAWLNARLYKSEWRPIPVEHRIRRFKKATDKPEILLQEVTTTLEQEGKVLVFVNSRRRSESLAEYLRTHGFRVDHNHAGLSKTARRDSQSRMRDGDTDVLIATSTLEMGVNFPARKVIIYDAYSFNGEDFSAISVQRYQQYAGRAGRAGFDPHGEAVLLVPNWLRQADRYLHASPEPVRSALFNTNSLLREVLCEVSGRLSISDEHLETNFAARTFWRQQDGMRNISLFTKHLITAGLIKEQPKGNITYLSATALGRIATQMQIAPHSIALFADFYRDLPKATPFDLLLTACLCAEATPKLGLFYEEIDQISECLASVSSGLLDQPADKTLVAGRNLNEKRLLAAIKCAVLMHLHIEGESLETIAIDHDCYVADLELLKRNLSWVLDAASRIFGVLDKEERDQAARAEQPHEVKPHLALARDLKLQVQYGVPQYALELVAISGIGAKRAQLLVNQRIFTIKQLLAAPVEQLGRLLRLREPSIAKILKCANATDRPDSHLIAQSQPRHIKIRPKIKNWPGDIDPYRLRRAISLTVDRKTAESIAISGGTEPHKVQLSDAKQSSMRFACDCNDFLKGTANCKHILRARLELREPLICELAQTFKNTSNQTVRFSLDSLWMKSGREYHTVFYAH